MPPPTARRAGQGRRLLHRRHDVPFVSGPASSRKSATVMAITKCPIWGQERVWDHSGADNCMSVLAIAQPANGASDMTTELRNDVGELSINIESKPRALRLKIAGLVFIVASFITFAQLDNVDFDKPVAVTLLDYVFAASAWLVAAHLLAVGLIIFLAGLKDVPLVTSTRARRGALQKLAGSTLIILCFGYAALDDMPAFHLSEEWYALPSLALFLITAHAGFKLLRSGWKYDVVSAEQLLETDPRRPVLYLRSFEADSKIVLRPDGFWNKATMLFDYMVTFSPEQELAEIMNQVGQMIAIGKPGEPLPELGAARLYVADADWKAKVTDMMERSRLVIIRTGSTPNLEWEIEQAITHVPRRQILFVSLGDAKETAGFDRYFEERFGRVMPSGKRRAVTPLWMKLMTVGQYAPTGKIIYFDESLRPREEPIQPTSSWMGLALRLMRPYRDSIQAATQHVFSSLELPWVTRNSQTMAVLLAMFGGMFGLHHFYLGDRRRGFKHLALFWTTIPMFINWYHTVKLAWLEPHEFDERYPPRQAIPSLSGREADLHFSDFGVIPT
jgi:TM2 domain